LFCLVAAVEAPGAAGSGEFMPGADIAEGGGECVMTKTKKFLARLWSDESGISSVEYALLLAFIAAGVAIAANTLGLAVENEIEDAADCVANGTAACT
jgi:pilus assembly protein Flp/PilA